MTKAKTLVISNLGIGDETFCNDLGCWNVSRALRDCKADKHKCFSLDCRNAYKANINVEVDEAKVKRFMQAGMFRWEFPPLIGVIEGGPIWIIDGHHRLRARYRTGYKDCAAYVIEEADAAPYKIWYNGERHPPFKV